MSQTQKALMKRAMLHESVLTPVLVGGSLCPSPFRQWPGQNALHQNRLSRMFLWSTSQWHGHVENHNGAFNVMLNLDESVLTLASQRVTMFFLTL